MNYFNFHIGDYASATRHLSWDEDMAYRRLLDAYYMREAPLPLDIRQVYRLVVAVSKPQRQAVDAVLGEFFIKTEAGFVNRRCEEDIGKFAAKRDGAKASAEERWRKARAGKTQSDGNANAMRTHMPTQSDGNAPNNQEPIEDSGSSSARDLLTELRKAAGWEQEPHPNLFVTGPIEALLQNGVDLDLDVLPTIRAIAPQAGSRTTWKYFLKAIVRARNDRVAAISAANDFSDLSDRSPTNGADRQKHSRSRNFAILDAIIAEAERREDEAGGTSIENSSPRAA